jgi:hypothetical protein
MRSHVPSARAPWGKAQQCRLDDEGARRPAEPSNPQAIARPCEVLRGRSVSQRAGIGVDQLCSLRSGAPYRVPRDVVAPNGECDPSAINVIGANIVGALTPDRAAVAEFEDPAAASLGRRPRIGALEDKKEAAVQYGELASAAARCPRKPRAPLSAAAQIDRVDSALAASTRVIGCRRHSRGVAANIDRANLAQRGNRKRTRLPAAVTRHQLHGAVGPPVRPNQPIVRRANRRCELDPFVVGTGERRLDDLIRRHRRGAGRPNGDQHESKPAKPAPEGADTRPHRTTVPQPKEPVKLDGPLARSRSRGPYTSKHRLGPRSAGNDALLLSPDSGTAGVRRASDAGLA